MRAKRLKNTRFQESSPKKPLGTRTLPRAEHAVTFQSSQQAGGPTYIWGPPSHQLRQAKRGRENTLDQCLPLSPNVLHSRSLNKVQVNY